MTSYSKLLFKKIATPLELVVFASVWYLLPKILLPDTSSFSMLCVSYTYNIRFCFLVVVQNINSLLTQTFALCQHNSDTIYKGTQGRIQLLCKVGVHIE